MPNQIRALVTKFENIKVHWFNVAVVIALSMIVTFIRVREQAPQLFPDEFLYLSAIRNNNIGDLPNYIYTLIYTPITWCGDNEYLCAKALNVVLFGVLLLLGFLIARALVMPAYSLLFVVFLGFGPLSGFTTLLTPEILFFVFTFLILLVFAYTKTWTLWFWLLIAFLNALLLLTKPHGVFLVIGLVGFLMFKSVKERKFLGYIRDTIVVVLGSYIFVIVLRFLLSGAFALNPLGARYSGAISRGSETLSGGPNQLDPSYMEPLNLVWSFVKQLASHTSIIAAILTVGVLVYGFRVLKARIEEVKDIELVFVFVFAAFVVGISLFSTVSVFWQELLQIRLMPRYYEHLMMLAPLFFLRGATFRKRVPVLLLSGAIFITLLLIQNSYYIFLFDSYFLGIWKYLDLPFALLALPGLIIALVAFKSAEIAKQLVFVSLTIFVVLFNFHYQLVFDRFTTQQIVTTDTLTLRDYLNDLGAPNTVIVASEQNEYFKVKFWLPSEKVQYVQGLSLSTLQIEELKNQYDVIVVINTTEIPADIDVVSRNETFSVIADS